MDYITLGAISFTVVFAIWGFFRGFWKSFAAIVSLIAAYFASVMLALPCSKILIKQFSLSEINEQILWGICGIALFITVGFVCRLAIHALGRALPIDSLIINRISGSLLSAGYGASMVIFIVWALSFSLETVDGATGVVKRFDVKSSGETPLVVRWSRDIMSKVLKWNAQKGGASEAVIELTQVFAKNPTETLGSIKMALSTPEFRDLVSSPTLQTLVRERDFEAIKRSDEYASLVASESVQSLQASLMPSGSAKEKDDIANSMLEFWHDIDIVRNDPEVSLLLQDAEVQQFLNGGGPVSLSLLSKGKNLLELVSTKADAHLPAMPEVYSWRDERNVIHVTDWDDIPKDKKESAKPVAH